MNSSDHNLVVLVRPAGRLNRAFGPNVFTTPIMAMGCRQYLSLSIVLLKGKYCRKLNCHNGFVECRYLLAWLTAIQY